MPTPEYAIVHEEPEEDAPKTPRRKCDRELKAMDDMMEILEDFSAIEAEPGTEVSQHPVGVDEPIIDKMT